MIDKFKTLIILFIFYTAVLCAAQNNLTFEAALKELPSQIEGNMIRDREGFLWFCYYGGIARYDGREIKYYTPGENSISGPAPLSIVMDNDGVLWILTKDNGLNKYDKETDKFTHFKHDPDNINSISSNISDGFSPNRLFIDNQNRLLIGTMGGFDIYDIQNNTFKHFSHDPDNANSLSSNNVASVIRDDDGIIWIGTSGGGLNSYDEKTNTWTLYAGDSEEGPSSNIIWSLLEDSEGNIWIGSWDRGISLFNKDDQTFTHFTHDPEDPSSLGDNKIYYLYEDSNNNVWVCHRDSNAAGIEMFDKTNSSFIRYTADSANPLTISSNSVNTVYEDPVTGIFWVLNSLSGIIDKHDKDIRKFNIHTHDPAKHMSISSSLVLVMLEDDDENLWISVNGSLDKYNPESGKFTHHPYDEIAPQMGNITIAMCWENRTDMWLLSNRGVLTLFDTKNLKVLKQYYPDNGDPDSIMITTSTGGNIIKDKDDPDILWIALSSGVEKFNKKRETFTHFTHDPDNHQSITQGTVWSVYDDGKGYLWASTFGGLNKFDKDKEVFTRFIHDPDNAQGIGFTKQSIVFEDSFGNFWVAGFTNGMDLLDRETGVFTHFNKENNFPSIGINQTIQEDDNGNLWIGTTDVGLIKFNIQNREVDTVYTKSDGLQDNHIWRSYKKKDGQMWFGGGFGVNSFYPDDVKKNPAIPPVYLTSITMGGEKIDFGKAPELLEEITLGWQDNYFEFTFAALNYSKPEKNSFAYMLEGRDKDWYYSDDNPTGRYTGLKGGSYTLRLKASNNDGIWNEEGASLEITVIPPFWESIWFYSLIILILLSVIWFTAAYMKKLSHEIHERKSAEKALSESEEKYRILIDSSPDLIYRTDLEGKIIFVSNAVYKLSGYTYEESIGMKMAENVYADPSEREKLLSGLKKNGVVYNFEARLKRKDGSIWWASSNVHFYKDKEGSVIGVEGITRDITEKKQAEEESIKLQEQLNHSRKLDAVGQLAGGVAHDFNNMLAGIMGAAQLLNINKNDVESKEYIDMIMQSSERAADLTSKLLAFARKGKKMSTAVDVHKVLDDTLSIFNRTIDKKIKISLIKNASNHNIIGDNTSLQNALINLGINASHAMPAGGEILIETENIVLDEAFCKTSPFETEPGDFIKITVSDTGSGIADENLHKIFEPFFTTRGHEGTGLGLAAVYGTVKDHHGIIDVKSEVGVGTSFDIFLPCSVENDKSEDYVRDVVSGAGQILLVDDEEILRITGKVMLEEMGYKVLTAENGREAVEIFKEHHGEIDIVIMDMIMSEMNGRDAFYKMKEIDDNCKVIISSGFTRDENLTDMKDAGLSGFINKPFRNTELSHLLVKVLNENSR